MAKPRVLLVDEPSAASKRLAAHLKKSLALTAAEPGAAQAKYAQHPPSVVVVGEGHSALCKTLKLHDPAAVTLALVRDAKAQRSAERSGADLALARAAPQAVEAAVRALLLVRAHRSAQTTDTPIFDPATGFYAFEHFKQALFVEVKRAKRYKLPIALVLASISAHAEDPGLRAVLMGGLALAVRTATRDTDLPVAYAQHNVMILLPQTDAAGAELVARRILFRIARSALKHDGQRLQPNLALGLAASDGDRPFSELVHEATTRLHEAEARGGNCLVAA